ncbi:hypothetical protein NE237_016261 [Protea cynaroides]|uniref:Uncharacterized protein n=1 Tax=Protea cynaroides TaxID=273540 RepID=A0A9Q0KFN3_9MAGN|nr:hypothetical protein NE237_016261 [Protea cynaroides]
MAYPSAFLTQISEGRHALSLSLSLSHVYTAVTTANNYFSQETQDSGQEMKGQVMKTRYSSHPPDIERGRELKCFPSFASFHGLKRPRNTKASSVTNQPTQLLFYINMPSNNRM